MCAASRGDAVRTEDEVGPNRDKHALIIPPGYREIHLGPHAENCSTCREALKMSEEDT